MFQKAGGVCVQSCSWCQGFPNWTPLRVLASSEDSLMMSPSLTNPSTSAAVACCCDGHKIRAPDYGHGQREMTAALHYLCSIWYHVFQHLEPGTPDAAPGGPFWRAHRAPHRLSAGDQNHNQMWDLECHISICAIDGRGINTTCGGEGICQAMQKQHAAFISLHACPPSSFRSRCCFSCWCERERLIFLTWIDNVGCGAHFLANQCKGSKQYVFVLTFFPL